MRKDIDNIAIYVILICLIALVVVGAISLCYKMIQHFLFYHKMIQTFYFSC